MGKKYIKVYLDLLDALEPLDDAERGRLFTSLLEYSRLGAAPELCGNERFLFPMLRAQLDRDGDSYAVQCQTNADNGRLGGAPFGNNNRNQAKQPKSKQDKDKDKDKDKEGGDASERKPRSTPPTVAEVASYVAQRRSPVVAEEFCDFYAAKGWMVGKTPMKDWKAACRNAEKWERWQRKGVGKEDPYSDVL